MQDFKQGKLYRFLVLFEEMAPYFLECLRDLSSRYPVKILVIAKQVNPVAPFEFDEIPDVEMIYRENYDEKTIIEKIIQFSPHATYVSGWIYPSYLSWIKLLSLKKVILGFDTQWNGSMKQRIGSYYFRLFRKKYYEYAFVPSRRQFILAEKLGFSDDKIIPGLYCCDSKRFLGYYERFVSHRKEWPHNILFMGRMVPEKGIDVLQKAFITWKQHHPQSEWKLIIAGKGSLKVEHHPDILYEGFVQPDKTEELIKKTGLFVLPSRYEPYGVVLHEMTLSGIPLVASVFCGASDDYVESGKNGYILKSITEEELRHMFEKILHLPDESLKKMSQHSVELGKKLLLEHWSEKIFKILCHE
jgi:glycosyltransferase involved in cell wall biosynthesis